MPKLGQRHPMAHGSVFPQLATWLGPFPSPSGGGGGGREHSAQVLSCNSAFLHRQLDPNSTFQRESEHRAVSHG